MVMAAMFAIAAAPVFALNCCCKAPPAAGETIVQAATLTPQSSTAPSSTSSSVAVPSCHGHHSSALKPTLKPSLHRSDGIVATKISSTKAIHRKAQSLAASGPSFERICQCHSEQESSTTLTEPVKPASQFTAAVLALPVATFVGVSPDTLTRSVAIDESPPPSGYSLAFPSGRAPPVI